MCDLFVAAAPRPRVVSVRSCTIAHSARLLAITALLSLALSSSANATLIASFSFNGLPGSGDAGSQVNADSSSAVGQDGSNYVVPGSIGSFSVGPGTTENKTSGNSFSMNPGQSLAIDDLNGGNNGQYILFKFSVNGFTNLTSVPFSFAAKQSTSTAFSQNTIKVSRDPNVAFAAVDGVYTPRSDNFTTAIFNLSLVPFAKTNTLYLELFFGNATGKGLEYIDNVNLGESTTPELNSTFLFTAAAGSLLLLRRRSSKPLVQV